ncbi:hypothetical protein OC834_007833 [Tilletia horrida]|nr:hypothetical protein OC834_007833 [Tilletia horrida]
MLPMFRRLFEAILVRRLSPDHQWAQQQLHLGQAGFWRGWSCSSLLSSSALLYNNEAAHTRRSISVFLDTANAFPSVKARLFTFILRERGAPVSTQARNG